MCCCGCELAVALAAMQAAEAAAAAPRAEMSRSALPISPAIVQPVIMRHDGTAFVKAMKQALRWWLTGDTPLARLDRGSGR